MIDRLLFVSDVLFALVGLAEKQLSSCLSACIVLCSMPALAIVFLFYLMSWQDVEFDFISS